MIPTVPYLLREDCTLEPDRVSQNLQRLYSYQLKEVERRWSFDEIVVPLYPNIISSTPAGQRTFSLPVPRDAILLSRELWGYHTSGQHQFTLSTTGVTVPDVVLSTNGNLPLVARDFNGRQVSAGTTLTFTVESSTTTQGSGWLVLTLAYDRHEGSTPDATVHALNTLPMSSAKSLLNLSLTNMATLNTTLDTNNRRQRLVVVPFQFAHSGAIAANNADIPVPAGGGTVSAIRVVACADATVGAITATLRNDTPADVISANVTGTGTGSLVVGTETASVQAVDQNNFAAGTDWHIRWARASASGNIYAAYAILTWTR